MIIEQSQLGLSSTIFILGRSGMGKSMIVKNLIQRQSALKQQIIMINEYIDPSFLEEKQKIIEVKNEALELPDESLVIIKANEKEEIKTVLLKLESLPANLNPKIIIDPADIILADDELSRILQEIIQRNSNTDTIFILTADTLQFKSKIAFDIFSRSTIKILLGLCIYDAQKLEEIGIINKDEKDYLLYCCSTLNGIIIAGKNYKSMSNFWSNSYTNPKEDFYS